MPHTHTHTHAHTHMYIRGGTKSGIKAEKKILL